MKPAIWTSILEELSPVEAVKAIASTGWEAVELSTEHIGMIVAADRPEHAADELRTTIEKLGLAMPQVHLHLQANVAAADDEARERDIAMVMRQIELCERMGITIGVIHPGGQTPASLEDERRERIRRVESFTRLAEHAAAHGVALAVENMNDRARASRSALGQRRYGATIPELHELIDEVGAPNLGICLDVGHGNVQGLDMAEAVRQCGSRLIATHIQDNDGSRDQHLAPPNGTIDWRSGIAALRDIGYDGLFNLEIPGEPDLPVELTLKLLEAILATTRWLLSR